MKRLFLILVLIACIAMLFSCGDNTGDQGMDGAGECTHSWSVPTCKTGAICQLCGAEGGGPGGHTLVEGDTVTPTCTNYGYTNYTCPDCGLTVRADITDPVGHSFGDWATDNSIKMCDDGRISIRECSKCGYDEVDYTAPVSHTLVSHSGLAPTCTEAGYKEYETCENCPYTTYEPIPASHSYTETVIPPTCLDIGYTTHTCSVCGDSYNDTPTDTIGHDLVSHGAKASTCTESGHEAYEVCKNCSYTTYKEIPASHSYTQAVLPPTCLEGGYTTHTCSGCGDSYKDSFQDPTGHAMGEWYQVSDATTTSDGEMRSSCLNCSHFETKGLNVVISGNFGAGTTPSSSVTYTLYDNGTLKISGTGATFNCGWSGANQPFKDYRDSITKLVIGEGITENSGGDFTNLSNLLSIEFPSTFSKINTNAFMDSFKKGIDTITIPESVTYVGCYIVGPFSSNNAVFTNIIFENPNTVFYTNPSNTANERKIFNNGAYNSSITLYSYGASNNVSAYAAKIGATYVDLNERVFGTSGNVSYDFFDGTLTLSAQNGSAALPSGSPWLNYIEKSKVTSLVIGEGITEIPAGYFTDYTALTEVKISDTVTKIGDSAFSASTACAVALSVRFPEGIATLGASIFKNRSNVTVSAFSGSAADSYSESGVTVNLMKVFRLLLIGNSLSLDAADHSGGGTSSMLYDIIKSMLGENSYVEIATLYSGARTAAWHATMARDGVSAYQFSVVSDETDGKWSIVQSSCTSEYGLKYRNWDVVTLQPYGNETLTGIDDTTTGISGSYKDEAFLSLSASLPFMLDHIAKYSSDSEIYYYLTWSSSTYSTINTAASKYNTMIDVALTASAYVGETGRFSGIIPVGTSIQNARSTYLALLNYTDGNSLDNQKNLQRDNVHLSFSVGRYIAALTFAEILIPKEMRAESYTLPAMDASPVIGELPIEYTTLAQLAVAEAVASGKSGKYAPTAINGYAVDPATAWTEAIAKMSFAGIKATDSDSLVTALASLAKTGAPDGLTVVVTLNDNVSVTATPSPFSATVKVTYGYTTVEIQISGTVST